MQNGNHRLRVRAWRSLQKAYAPCQRAGYGAAMKTRRLSLALAALVLAAPALAEPEALTSAENRGPDLPPLGRSLLDFVLAEQVDGRWQIVVPYPFEALTDRIAARLGPGFREPIKRVLHPIGRSLHRHEAEPEFFRYPRAVGAVDTEPAPASHESGLMMKDRLYLGYQPRTNSVEAISYNEAAGRFEYQVISDYREGGAPTVGYVDRGLCLACHHNHALIYADRPWAESNTNIKVAALLRSKAERFYGIDATVPFDIPESFDEATDRANWLGAYQAVWQQACEASGDAAAAVVCRRDGLVAALRYRLTGGYQLGETGDGARSRFAAAVMAGWQARFPDGLAIAGAGLADYDPFAEAGYGSGRMDGEEGLAELASLVTPALLLFDDIYEPLYERAPVAVWSVAKPFAGMPAVEPHWLSKTIAGLGDFLALADIQRLDARLREGARPAREATTACEVRAESDGSEFGFTCAPFGDGGLVLRGRLRSNGSGSVARLRSDSAAPGGLVVEDGSLRRDGEDWQASFALRDSVTSLGARSAAGDAWLSVSLIWSADGEGTATVVLADDFAALTAAVSALAERTLAGESDALGNAPFRRVAVLQPLFADLGIDVATWCCLGASHLPPARLYFE